FKRPITEIDHVTLLKQSRGFKAPKPIAGGAVAGGGPRRQEASCELIAGKLDHCAALGRPSIKVERDVIVGRASVIGFLGVYPALAELMHAATMISMCMGRHCDEGGPKECRRARTKART